MKKALAIIGGIILVVGLACLVVFCIATAKDMTFVEYIQSWFAKTEEVANNAENVATALSNIRIGG